MKTAQKIVNNLINENIFPLKISSRYVIFGDNQFMSKHTFHIQKPSIGLPTLTNMLNGYDICLNTTNCAISNIQDFRYWLI